MKLPSLIGVIHLPALAGAPGAFDLDPAEALERAGLQAVREARLLEQAGFDAVLIENFGDAPFYKNRVPPETIASLSVISAAVREAVSLPLGINVLRNDARSALAIAAVTGCELVRANVLSGVSATDQGLIEGEAATLMRERQRLGASSVSILADVHVKHGRSLSSGSLETAIEETAGRGGADGIIISGPTTGRPVDPEQLELAGRACRALGVPLYVGSGASTDQLVLLRAHAHGVIVSSALRQSGQAGRDLDPQRVRSFAKTFRASLGASLKRAAGRKKKRKKVATGRAARR